MAIFWSYLLVPSRDHQRLLQWHVARQAIYLWVRYKLRSLQDVHRKAEADLQDREGSLLLLDHVRSRPWLFDHSATYLDHSSYNTEAAVGVWNVGSGVKLGWMDLLILSSFTNLSTSLNLSVLQIPFCFANGNNNSIHFLKLL